MKTTRIATTNISYNLLKAHVLLALLLLLGLPVMTGCGPQSAGIPDAPASDFQPVAPATVSKGVVLDSTSSTDPLFAKTVRDCLVDELGIWGGKEDTDLADGAEAIQGLDLWLFIVGDNATASYTTSEPLHINLPSVSALPARPSLEDEEALDAIHSWNKLKGNYEEDYEAFLLAREEAIASLQAFNIYTDQYSGIFSTVGLLSGVVSPGTDTLIASDLENNRDTQIAGTLEGSKVYILQPTPSGDMAYADELYSTTVSCLVDMGVDEGDILRYRNELAKEAIHTFMSGD
jgi:hypothetical protein